MSTTVRQRVRAVSEDASVTPLELFFDLVFVYALTQVTALMAADPTAEGVLHGMIVAVFVLVATVANLAAIPHPTWLWPAAIILIPAAG